MIVTLGYTNSSHLGYESNLVSDIYYNGLTETLYVQLHGGRIYSYKGVPFYVYNDFAMAQSAGRYYNSQIKHHYTPAGEVGDKSRYKLTSIPSLSVVETEEYEVVYEVTITQTVKVQAVDFNEANKLALEETNKLFSDSSVSIKSITKI